MIIIDTEKYNELLNNKIVKIEKLFQDFKLDNFETFTSPNKNYRMRCEFTIKHQNNSFSYIMFDKKKYYELDQFLVASSIINHYMPIIKEKFSANNLLKNKLFQINFLSTTNNQIIITTCYHKHLDNEWVEQATQIREKLKINIIGRAKKQKIIIGSDYLIDEYNINKQNIKYVIPEGSFSQPNAIINQKMLSWINNKINGLNIKDLIEIYCGNGNFSIAIANKINNILATEINRNSIKALKQNLELNQIKNIFFARMSAKEIIEALSKIRLFNRLKDIPLDNLNFNSILIDPPRSGLSIENCKFISKFENIIYISCNPCTLKQNIQYLSKTHNIIANAIFDQFPYTEHVEMGIILSKK